MAAIKLDSPLPMTTACPVRVLLIHGEAFFRLRLEQVISRLPFDMVLVGSAASGSEALGLLASVRDCDVALVDLGISDIPGVELLGELVRRRPELACVALCTPGDSAEALEALRAGAQGCLARSESVPSLLQGLREAGRGEAALTPASVRLVVRGLREEATRSRVDVDALRRLTPREQEVLALLGKGMSYGETAELLEIRLGTVQSYVKQIYRKLHVCTKAEAAAVAQRAGLI